MGYLETPDWLLFVARDRKLLEKAGLAPTYVTFAAGPPMIAAAQNGSLCQCRLRAILDGALAGCGQWRTTSWKRTPESQFVSGPEK
jgi:hypothetical protein